VESPSSGEFLVPELVISGGNPILTVDSTSMSWKFPAESLFILWRASVGSSLTKFFRGFLVYEQVIPGRITIYTVEGECWQSAKEKSSRIPYSKGSLPPKLNFFK
jgi:hypothetical protein